MSNHKMKEYLIKFSHLSTSPENLVVWSSVILTLLA